MYKRTPVLLMLSVAAAIIAVREIRGPGSFVGGFAVGLLIVGLGVEWFEHLRSRKP